MHPIAFLPAEPGASAEADQIVGSADGQDCEPDAATERAVHRRQQRLLWAELLLRTFDVDALACPFCAGRMRIISTIMKADVIRAILKSLGISPDAPFIHPSRGPPDMLELCWE